MTDETEPRNESPDERELGRRISPGYLLRTARERKGLTVEEVSAQTLLAESTVRALEGNDFKRLSQPVFVRGYYRKCAALLDVPEDDIMDAYAEWSGESGPQPASPAQVDVVPEDVTPQPWRRSTLVLLIVAVLALAALTWLWLAEPRAEPEPDAGTPATDVSPATPSRTPNSEPRIPNTESPAAAAPAQSEVAAEPPSAPLVLRFDSRSWVRVTDAGGATLIDGIVGGGNVRVLEGRPPYRVSLGYAPGVNVSVGGRHVPITDRVRADGTARFTVDAGAGGVDS